MNSHPGLQHGTCSPPVLLYYMSTHIPTTKRPEYAFQGNVWKWVTLSVGVFEDHTTFRIEGSTGALKVSGLKLHFLQDMTASDGIYHHIVI